MFVVTQQPPRAYGKSAVDVEHGLVTESERVGVIDLRAKAFDTIGGQIKKARTSTKKRLIINIL
jgi:hypothetical protein